MTGKLERREWSCYIKSSLYEFTMFENETYEYKRKVRVFKLQLEVKV